MPNNRLKLMRTTLTLDDDVAAKVHAAANSRGISFRQAVNEYLRMGLMTRKELSGQAAFRVTARDLGELPGLNYDNIAELLQHLDGAANR
jgi:hypothetical protein